MGLGLLAAVVNAVVDDVEHSRMQTKRGRDEPADIGVIFCSGFHKGRDVFGPVAAGRQEVWEDNNLRRALFYAGCKRLSNRGFSKFHVRGFDDRVLRLRSETFGGGVEHCIALTTTRTMVDDNDAGD